MLGRGVRTVATGAVFTLVGVGLAYAVPQSLGESRVSGRAHIALVGSEDDRRGAYGRGGPSPSDRRETGPKATGKRSGIGGAAHNHGAAVRVAAHCDVPGRAHGELVRSIAGDEEATVADATAACARAEAGADGPGEAGKSHGPAKPAKPPKAAKSANPARPATPAKPATPGTPATPAMPAKPATPATPAKPDQSSRRGKPDSAGNSGDDHGPGDPSGRSAGRPPRPR
jgi:hypothetical protein